MTTVIGGSSPSITFSDSTTQSTAALPLTGGSVSADITVHGLTVGLGGASGAANTAYGVSAIPIAPNSGVVAIGNSAGKLFNTSSDTGQSTFVGYSAGASCVSGTDNTFVGGSAGTNTTGSKNTALGSQALQLNTSASSNTAVGYQAGYANTTGTYNTYIGYSAGSTNTTASGITCVGYNAGNNVGSAASNSTYIGYGVQANNTSTSNEIVIGTGGNVGKGNSTGYIAPYNGGVYQGNNSTTWSTTSDQRLKKNIVDNTVGLSAITQIKVRNFEYRLPDEVTDLDKSNAVNITGTQLGVIAQELQQILPDCVKTESTGVMSVDASNVLWHLVNAVQQLNALITAQATEIQALKAKVGA